MSNKFEKWQKMLAKWEERITMAERTPGSRLPREFPADRALEIQDTWQRQQYITPVSNTVYAQYTDLRRRWEALKQAQQCAPTQPPTTVGDGDTQPAAPMPIRPQPYRVPSFTGGIQKPTDVPRTALPATPIEGVTPSLNVNNAAEGGQSKSSSPNVQDTDEETPTSQTVDNTVECNGSHSSPETVLKTEKDRPDIIPEADSDSDDASYAPVGHAARMANMRSMVGNVKRLRIKAKPVANMPESTTTSYSSTAMSGIPQRQADIHKFMTFEKVPKPTEASSRVKTSAPTPLCSHTLDFSCGCDLKWSKWALGYETSLLNITRDLTIFRLRYTNDETRELWFCISVSLDGGCQDPTCVLRHWAPEPNERLWMSKTGLKLLDECIWKPAPNQPGYKGKPRYMRDGRWCYGPGDVRKTAPKGISVINKARPLKALYTDTKNKKQQQQQHVQEKDHAAQVAADNQGKKAAKKAALQEIKQRANQAKKSLRDGHLTKVVEVNDDGEFVAKQ
ncbi:hypothetical protein GRF29_8g3523454 [Pseudopithomyces chartarum]|uniref:Uncharacterized protein n=1 Tax=Pseudopithomyces chartarum TaxID=1892770 RepID=A0AAN6RMV0_9PLEO|nr:hypothetical protein GRF29_8g3523454 [Pseudopithomyces chartarum]